MVLLLSLTAYWEGAEVAEQFLLGCTWGQVEK